ncbi:Structure-specific endonuclease subunit SLX4 [Pyrenophora seminiperda CCB06]|uniref:Structure-specific endonuclease subunit SLX4 n=1 Tax=Pyrenophora seminiperda CCB06 TaxID=1302712 RepID=A0A3M7M259_9PLEO|nr:Structure-specific endonuclease subunit SLX4 [Pyrenophora seminiperda CCB06]
MARMAGHSYQIVVLSSSPPAASPHREAYTRRVAMSASPLPAFSPTASPTRATTGASRLNLRAAPIPEGAVRGFATVGSLIRSDHFTAIEPTEVPPLGDSLQVTAHTTTIEKPKRATRKKDTSTSATTTIADKPVKPTPKPRAPRKPKPKSDIEIPDSEDERRHAAQPTKSHFFTEDPEPQPEASVEAEAANSPKLTKSGKPRKPRAKKLKAGEGGDDQDSGDAPVDKPKRTRVTKPKAVGGVAKGGKQQNAPVVSAHFQAGTKRDEDSIGQATRAQTKDRNAPVEHASIWDVPDSPRPKKSAAVRKQLPSPVSQGLDLEEAVARRRDWTPPLDTAPLPTFTESAGKENEESAPGADVAFNTMLSNFAFAQPPVAPASTTLDNSTTGGMATKRRRVELLEIRSNQINSRESSPEKGKAPKKKPRTITDFVTDQYIVRDSEPDTNGTTGTLFEARTSTTKIPLNDTDVSPPLKKPPRKRNTSKPASDKVGLKAKPKRTSAKSAKPKLVAEKLLSPTSALSRLSKQDVLFGTSSQLVLDESPTMIRQIQSAIKESEQDGDSFTLPKPPRWPRLGRVQSKRGLWAASTRDDEGGMLEDMPDLYIPEHDRTQEIPLLMDIASDEPDGVADDPSSFIDIDDIPLELPSAILISSDLPTPPRNPSHASQMLERGKPDHPMTDAEFEDIDNFEQEPPPSNQNAGHNDSFVDIDDIEIPPSAQTQHSPAIMFSPPASTSVTDVGSPKKRGRASKPRAPKANVPISSAPALKPLSSKAKRKPRAKSKSPVTPLRSSGRFIDIDEILDSEDEHLEILSPTPPRTRKHLDSGPLPLLSLSPTRSPSKAKKPTTPKRKAKGPPIDPDVTPVHCIPNHLLAWEHIKPSVFSQLTTHIRSLPPTTDPAHPSWHEKILMYDPIMLEDLTRYINAHTSIRTYRRATQKQARAWNKLKKADGAPLVSVDKDGDGGEVLVVETELEGYMCDEERPKCGCCKKKDRPCTYSYGKASVFVVQDIKNLTKYGIERTVPVMHSISASGPRTTSSPHSPSDLRITTERHAENGQGFFQTLAPRAKCKSQMSKKKLNHQQRGLEAHLQHLQAASVVVSYFPTSPETTLISRYIGMLGSDPAGKQPLEILGIWTHSIPSRMGSNRMLDLAAEFLVNSYAAYRDGMHSKRKLATQSKAKALRELQLVVSGVQNEPTYDVVLATKMHFAAEVRALLCTLVEHEQQTNAHQALMGIDTMYHAIHAHGLTSLLKSGLVSNTDSSHFWDLIDNTYIDDVNEAMLSGRKSVFDNPFYLAATYPSRMQPPLQKASLAIMHVFIQCPRAVCFVRHAITHPTNPAALASAVSYLESLIAIPLPYHVATLMATVTSVPIPPDADMADIMPTTLEYNSVASMVLCTRYWTLQMVLCGLADTLHRHFSVETHISEIPPRERLRKIDTDAGLHFAQSLRWASGVTKDLPLVPLRLHTPLQMAIGPWYRTLRWPFPFSTNAAIAMDEDEVARAARMKDWMIQQCNKFHNKWGIAPVAEEPLLQALDAMAGEEIPSWLPVRVRFVSEEGEMVMQAEYENETEKRETWAGGDGESGELPGTCGWEGWCEDGGSRAGSGDKGKSVSVRFDNRGLNACLAPSWRDSGTREVM